MNKLKIRQIIFGMLSIACMAIIFLFSSDNASESTEKSSFFAELLVRILGDKGEIIGDSASYIVRKAAHFTIYAVLGFLVSGIFAEREVLYTLSICFLYACTDEIHQYFVPERACRFQDVMIDSSGAIFGIFIFIITTGILHKKPKNIQKMQGQKTILNFS